jgi:hypothetical protein
MLLKTKGIKMQKKTRKVSFMLHGWGKISRRVKINVPETIDELTSTWMPSTILAAFEAWLFEAETNAIGAVLGRSANKCGQGSNKRTIIQKRPKQGLFPAGQTPVQLAVYGDPKTGATRVVDSASSNLHKAMLAEQMLDRDP